MDLPRFFVFYCLAILYSVNFTHSSFAFPIDYNEEMDRLKGQLSGITDPEQREQKLLRIVVQELQELHQEALKKYGELMENIGAIKDQKNMVEKQLNSFIYPLTVAYWGLKIENQNLDLEATAPPEEVEKLNRHEKNTLEREYKWVAILTTRTDQMYVRSIVKEMKSQFRTTHHIEESIDPQTDDTWQTEYKEFVKRFAHAVVYAIEHRNELVHSDFVRDRIDALQVFFQVYDKYLTIFYNSLFGNIKPVIPATIKPIL